MQTQKVISNKRILLASCYLWILVFTSCATQKIGEKEITVVFRYDDYGRSTSTVAERYIINTFKGIGASVTFGIIPFECEGNIYDPSPQKISPLGDIKGNILNRGISEGIIDVALHGYAHQTISAKPYSEFAGLDCDTQIEKLLKAKHYLEGIIEEPITSFIPPWNTFDLNTLRALEKVGFTTLSGSMSGPVTTDSRLKFLPATTDLAGLKNAVRTARISSDRQPVIVVLFHEFEIKEIDEIQGIVTFDEFRDLIYWAADQSDVQILSISQAAKTINDLSSSRFRRASKNYMMNILMPLQSLRGRAATFYPEAPNIIVTLLKVAGFYLACVGLGTLLSFLIAHLLFPKPSLLLSICTYGVTGISVIMVMYTLRDLDISYKGLIISAALIGMTIGFWLSYSRVKIRKIGIDRKVNRC